MSKNINARIVCKHDSPSNWDKATNFVPKLGEIIIYDAEGNVTPRMKIGDGVTNINELLFSTAGINTIQGGEIFNDYENNQAISEFSSAAGKNNQVGQKGYYWFNLDPTNKTFTLSSTQMVNTPVHNIPWTFSEEQPCYLSISDESSAFTDCCKIEEVFEDSGNTYIRVDTLPDIRDIRGNIPEDYEHVYVCDFAVWCVDQPEAGTVDIGLGSYARGVNNVAKGTAASATGYLTKATGLFSHTEGLRTTASGERAHAEGSDTVASGDCSHAEGYQTLATGSKSHSEGSRTEATGDFSHSEGMKTYAKGYASHTEGVSTTASGDYSHAEGVWVTAVGKYQHVQGRYNLEDYKRYADGNLILDSNNNPIAANKYAHIVGNGTAAVKDKNTGEIITPEVRSNAHTLDWDGNAWFAGDVKTGKGVSLNELKSSVAVSLNELKSSVVGKKSSSNSTAEIFNDYDGNNATGNYSHAEGRRTKALAIAAHAEGMYSEATAEHAHAEGRYAFAKGITSHAEGTRTIATSENQHVQGKYNIEDYKRDKDGNLILNSYGYPIPGQTYAHIVGNGNSNNRSNAHTLDWDGNAWFAGTVSAAGLILTEASYGESLPTTGVPGQIFFLKV